MRMTSRLLLLGLTLGTAVAVGCAHHTERREERREVVESHGDWVKLGERWVDGAHDRDVIPVGAREGRYRRIRIVVERSALELYAVVVTFGDGTPFSPQT